MARLDPLIKAIREHKAGGLVLAPGKPASLLFETGLRAISREPLTAAQLLPLVRELTPPGMVVAEEGAPVSFEYRGAGDPVVVEVAIEALGPRVLIRPASSGQPAQPAVTRPAPPAAGVGGALTEINRLLGLLVEEGGSDLHLRTGEPPIIRKDGELIRLDGQPLGAEAIDAMLTSIMRPEDQSRFRETGDADWAYEIEGLARFRSNGAQERRGPMGVFRVIPSKIVTADELGLSAEVQRLCYLTKGLVLLTGPTGSGKSTTLAAMVDLMNRTRSDHILTIEDPVEFVHPPKRCVVTQRQVGQHSRSFKVALRAALREDPDIIMVGEMRDLETIAIALETAETGHLVFGTLHTTTAASTIDRIIDQFPADRQSQVRVMLADSLKGVVAQVLCRRIGGGRVAAKEVLLTIPAISNLIREGKTFQIPSIMQTNRRTGMVMLNDALLELVDQKLIEPKEAYLKAVEKIAIAAALKAKKHDLSFLEGS